MNHNSGTSGLVLSPAIAFGAGLLIGGAACYYFNKAALRTLTSATALEETEDADIDIANGEYAFQSLDARLHSHQQASVRNFEHDDIVSEHLTRNIQFFGLEAQKHISNAFVVVVGLGVSYVWRFWFVAHLQL